MTTDTTATDYAADVPATLATDAFSGVSFSPEKRGENIRDEYARTLRSDYEALRRHAEAGGMMAALGAEFEHYRKGYCLRLIKYLNSRSRCVSWFIAGPARFPVARMEKRSNISHKRLGEMLDYRTRALAAIRRTLRPDLRSIYNGDGDAVERLEAKLERAKIEHERNKQINVIIRKNAKAGKEGQLAALVAFGLPYMMAAKLITPDCMGDVGMPAYRIALNSGSIREMEKRLAHLQKCKAAPDVTKEGANARLEDCPAENRVRLFYQGKPERETIAALKANGFRWTPSLGCWQAYRTALHRAYHLAGIAA